MKELKSLSLYLYQIHVLSYFYLIHLYCFVFKVDHVGGIAKVAIRQNVAAGGFFQCSEDMVEFLEKKFPNTSSVTYFFKTIDESLLDEERSLDRLEKVETVRGSDSFHVMVFSPGEDAFKASPRICVCEKCKVNFGSCELFTEYSLSAHQLNKIFLRGNRKGQDETTSTNENESEENDIMDF